MATTLTRYLKLKVADDLSADAKYNLNRLDSLGGISGATFSVDSTDNLNVRARGDIVIEPQSPDVGGSGVGGSIQLGDDEHTVDVLLLSSSFKVDSALSLLSNTTGTAPNIVKRYLNISPSGTLSLDRTLSVDVDDSNRALTVSDDGTVVVIKGDGLLNLVGPLTIGQGGTGADDAVLGTKNLVEGAAGSYAANAAKVLSVNVEGTALEWKAAGAGIVETISVSSPLLINNTIPALPSISLPAATSGSDGYLSSVDWSTFNSKQNPGNYITSLTGVVVASGPGAAVTTLSATGVVPGYYPRANIFINPDGRITSAGSSLIVDADISATAAIAQSKVANLTSDLSGLQTALDGKYSTTNPAAYVDASGAKTAAVVNSTAGTETDQAASVSAMKSYISGVVGGGKVAVDWLTADGVTKAITHSLGTRDVTVEIYDENYETIYVDSVVRTDSNTVTLTSSSAPTTSWRVLIRS
jgi:hypothetical protein